MFLGNILKQFTKLRVISSITVSCSFIAISALAQSELATPTPDPDAGLPKSGVLSGTYTGSDRVSAKIPWGKEGSAADSVAPVSGSVSRINDKQWQAKVFNNSDDAFSVSVRVRQYGKRGEVVKTDSFSATLKPKSANERTFSSASTAQTAQLELVSWKRLASAKTAPTAEPTIITPQTELQNQIEELEKNEGNLDTL